MGCIEHGSLIDEDTLKLMAAKNVHLCPTLIVQDVSWFQGDQGGVALIAPLASSSSMAR